MKRSMSLVIMIVKREKFYPKKKKKIYIYIYIEREREREREKTIRLYNLKSSWEKLYNFTLKIHNWSRFINDPLKVLQVFLI